jgi:ABC-type phosphate/phosphonate transport system permease subunit
MEEIKELINRTQVVQNNKLGNGLNQFAKLLSELRKKDIPTAIVNTINQEIDKLNGFSGSDKELLNQVRKTQSLILSLVKKELGLVPKCHFQTLWMVLGMATFGIPFGVVFGLTLGNMAFFAIGLPIGLSIGLAIGAGMDKKAQEEGRQLDIEIKA